MFIKNAILILLSGLILAVPGLARGFDAEALADGVRETERAFAATMATRDHAAFTGFLAEEAVFFSGEGVLRGKQQVAEAWKPWFEQADAPFSWSPDAVEVLESGNLALSSGPVFGPNGERVATFTSVWRRKPTGQWEIVFDKGQRYCEPPTAVD